MKYTLLILLIVILSQSCTKIEPELKPLYGSSEIIDRIEQDEDASYYVKISDNGVVWILNSNDNNSIFYRYDGNEIISYPVENEINLYNGNVNEAPFGLNGEDVFFVQESDIYFEMEEDWEWEEKLPMLSVLSEGEFTHYKIPAPGDFKCLDLNGAYVLVKGGSRSDIDEELWCLKNNTWQNKEFPTPLGEYGNITVTKNNYVINYTKNETQFNIWVFDPLSGKEQNFSGIIEETGDFNFFTSIWALGAFEIAPNGNLYYNVGNSLWEFNFATGEYNFLEEGDIVNANNFSFGGKMAINQNNEVWMFGGTSSSDSICAYNALNEDFFIFNFEFDSYPGHFVFDNSNNLIAYSGSEITIFNREQVISSVSNFIYSHIDFQNFKVDKNNSCWLYSNFSSHSASYGQLPEIVLYKNNNFEHISNKLTGNDI
jgi:hypothetical protein